MKPFLVLLLPLVLVGCGAEPDAATEDVLSVSPPEPVPATQETPPAAPAESDAAVQEAAVDATKDPEPAPHPPNASPTIQADAIAAIEKLGGTVNLDKTSGEVVEVHLLIYGTKITDAGLVHLKDLTNLTYLGLGGTQITDAGLEHLKGMTNLTRLDLSSPQITDAGLEHLKGMTSLTMLALGGTQITDAGLEHLKGMTSLAALNLDNTQITDAGLVHLKGMTSLTTLILASTQITDAGLEHLKGLTSLTHLDLGSTQITDAGLEQIKAALPNCRIPAESAAAVHEAARRRQSKNKLQQLGLAMHIYHDAWKHFPRGTVENLELKPEERLSWVVALLPYMGQAALYNQIDQKSAWDAVKNKQLSEMTVPTLQNPSQRRPSDMPGSMDYVAIGGIGPDAASLPKSDEKAGIFGYDRETRFRDITDGMSNTIAITDSSTPNTSYMQGGKLSIKSFSQQPYVNGPDGIGSPHAGGFQVSLADGSVRFVSENIDPKVLEALATMHGGEVIGEY